MYSLVLSGLLWTQVFSKPEEQELKKGSLITTFDQKKTWRISFEINPGSYPATGTYSIFQATQGNIGGKYGTRSPAVYLKNGGLMLYVNYLIKSRKEFSKSTQPPKNQWTSLVFEQREESDGKFVFKFFQAGVEMYTFQNSNPKEYTGMKVIARTQSPFCLGCIDLVSSEQL